MALVAAALVMVFPALVIVAALKDLTSYTIPNWISLALLAAFFPAAFAQGLPLTEIGLSAGIGFAGLLVGMGMFAAGWIGGGDAKLLAASVLWIGWTALAPFLLVTAVAGGALAIMLMAVRKQPLHALVPVNPKWLSRLASPNEAVPYGVAICIGALAVFQTSPIAHGLNAQF
ncbi:MAG: prepilin peptidase [Phenylobacterium sp.]